jgi:hypothetical protein
MFNSELLRNQYFGAEELAAFEDDRAMRSQV